MDYIKRIKPIKSEKKMTNDELAEATGIPGGTLAKILAGISESPKLSNFVAICKALNCSLDYIMYGIEENPHNYTLDADEIDMVERFRTLDARGRETVLAVLGKQESYVSHKEPPARRARIIPAESLQEKLAAAYETNDNGFDKVELPLYEMPVSAGVGISLDEESTMTISVRSTPSSREADFALRISGNSMEPRYHDGDILLVQEVDTLEYGDPGIFILNGCGFFKIYCGDRLRSLNEEYGDILLRDFDDARIAGKVIGKLKRK